MNDESDTPIQVSGRAVQVPVGGDASFNAPRSRDASDAVSAVFAALDAQVAAQSSADTVPAATATASTDGATTDTAPEPPAGGRRRGRRAAGRPAGAPATLAVPVVGASATLDAVEAFRESAGPAQVQTPVAVDDASTPVVANDAPVPDADAPVPDAKVEKEPKQGRTPARRRGSRAAGAAGPTAVTEPTPAPETTVTDQPVAQSPAPATNGSASEKLSVEGSSKEPAAAAPRRRRAASRPAGPAAAPAPVEVTVS